MGVPDGSGVCVVCDLVGVASAAKKALHHGPVRYAPGLRDACQHAIDLRHRWLSPAHRQHLNCIPDRVHVQPRGRLAFPILTPHGPAPASLPRRRLPLPRRRLPPRLRLRQPYRLSPRRDCLSQLDLVLFHQIPGRGGSCLSSLVMKGFSRHTQLDLGSRDEIDIYVLLAFSRTRPQTHERRKLTRPPARSPCS